MGTIKSYTSKGKTGPSTFALLIDDINKMSESEQKLLWLQINREKLSSFANEIDMSVKPNTFSQDEIDTLIIEARKYGTGKKKG